MKRILVADDSVTIQKVIALTFADEPFEVKSVGTGTEALELVKTWKPDILLADVIMPQMNGYELCRAIKEQPETASVPVLLLAGTFEAFDEEEAGSVRADDFITKPFESAELIGKVRSLTSGEVPPESVPEVREEAAATAQPDISPPVASQATEKVPPEPPSSAQHEEGAEPDIWDILSEVEELPAKASAEGGTQEVSSLNPLEEKGVIDVGSFDVGLDRLEPSLPPLEPEPESWTAPPPPTPEEEGPPEKEKPHSGESPFEAFTDEGPGGGKVPEAAPPAGDSDEELPEKSRVEDREKDFFGFEVEGFEKPPFEDALGDAVEEITFDLEEPVQGAGEPIPEESFLEPEGVAPMEPGPGVSESLLSEEVSEPRPERIPPADESKSPPPETPAGVPGLQGETDEARDESEPPFELDMKEAFSPGALPSTARLDEKQIRKIIEEKAEKIIWEVVPELAEVMIREAIEKIKGGS